VSPSTKNNNNCGKKDERKYEKTLQYFVIFTQTVRQHEKKKVLSLKKIKILWKWRFLVHVSVAHSLQVSISSTFYVQIFRTNIVFSSHMYIEKQRSYKKFVDNVDEIDTRMHPQRNNVDGKTCILWRHLWIYLHCPIIKCNKIVNTSSLSKWLLTLKSKNSYHFDTILHFYDIIY